MRRRMSHGYALGHQLCFECRVLRNGNHNEKLHRGSAEAIEPRNGQLAMRHRQTTIQARRRTERARNGDCKRCNLRRNGAGGHRATTYETGDTVKRIRSEEDQTRWLR